MNSLKYNTFERSPFNSAIVNFPHFPATACLHWSLSVNWTAWLPSFALIDDQKNQKHIYAKYADFKVRMSENFRAFNWSSRNCKVTSLEDYSDFYSHRSCTFWKFFCKVLWGNTCESNCSNCHVCLPNYDFHNHRTKFTKFQVFTGLQNKSFLHAFVEEIHAIFWSFSHRLLMQNLHNFLLPSILPSFHSTSVLIEKNWRICTCRLANLMQ